VQKAAQEYEVHSGSTAEILVVDDGSSDDTTSLLPLEFPKVNLIERSVNGGFAAACNSGFKECRGDLVALLNNDVQVARDYFIRHAEHFVDPQVFAVTAKVFDWDVPVFVTGGRFGKFRRGFWSVYFNYDVSLPEAKEWVAERRLLSYYAIGGFATYQGGKLREVGGFNELLSPFHWEDVDLCYRAWKNGWKSIVEPKSVVYHMLSGPIRSNNKSSDIANIIRRNRFLFVWKNITSPKYLYFSHLIPVFLRSLFGGFVADIDFYRALFSALMRLPLAREHRRQERQRGRRLSDEEIFELTGSLLNGDTTREESTAPTKG